MKSEAAHLKVQAVRWAGGTDTVGRTGTQEGSGGRTDKGVSARGRTMRCRRVVDEAWYQARVW